MGEGKGRKVDARGAERKEGGGTPIEILVVTVVIVTVS